MGDRSAIEWTDATWNPVTGCSKVSAGCTNCYAERVSHRFGWTAKPWNATYAAENVRLHPERLEQPLRWTKPRRVFVNSMSDLFHEQVPFEFIDQVFAVMALTERHTFQVLTKRPQRMLAYFQDLDERASRTPARGFRKVPYEDGRYCVVLEKALPDMVRRYGLIERHWPLKNVWIGVSVENQGAADERIPLLLQTPAAVRFLSCEPLLGPVDLSAYKPFDGECYCQDRPNGCKPRLAIGCPETAIDWVIVGGESGPHARPMHPDWVLSLRDQCQDAGVPFFFKQWGEFVPVDWVRAGSSGFPVRRVGKKAAGRLLDGRTWDEYPERSV
jgi:protein gp37